MNDLRVIVQRMVDAGEPEEAIAAVIQRLTEQPAEPDPTTARAASSRTTMGESITDALPYVGGMAGSLIGGSRLSPVGMALAGVGGAAGEAFKQVGDSIRGDFSDVPETVGGRLQQIASTGLRQAGIEGVGRGVGAAVQPVAKTIYGLALRPSKKLMRDAGGGKLLQGLRRIIKQGYDDNVMPSGMGVARAGRLVQESRDQATQVAAQSPHQVVTSRVMQRATDDQARRSAGELATAGVTPRTEAVSSQMGNLLGANPELVSMSQLLKIRRGAEDVAAPVFQAAKLPGGPGRVAPGSEASVARSISGAAKSTLDDVLGRSFKNINSRTQARMAVKKAVDDASSRPNMLTNLLAGSAGVASSSGDLAEAAKRAALIRALFSPSAMGAAALSVGKAPYAQLVRAWDVASQDQK